MQWILCDVSPSAESRGRTNEVQHPEPEQVPGLVDEGSVHLYFFTGEPNLTTEMNRDNATCVAQVQFWQGWVNQVNSTQEPLGEVVRAAFGPYKDKLKMSPEQIVAAFEAIDVAPHQ